MQDWVEHRRGDGERIGWIRPEGDSFVVVDLLGREDPTPRDWLGAEETLEQRGLGWLAEAWELVCDGQVVDVRITSVSPAGITVKTEDFGAIDVPIDIFHLPFPAPSRLRPRSPRGG